MTRSSESALKAWETRRKNQLTPSILKSKTKTYDLPGKNKFRDLVIKEFCEETQSLNAIVLESEDLLFVKALPNLRFFIFERDKETYENIVTKCPENVNYVFNGDISTARFIFNPIYYAFLDFCDTFESNVDTLEMLYFKLKCCKKLALTFCLRGNKKEIEDYKFDLIRKLNEVLPGFSLLSALVYKDGAPMVGIILNNNEEDFKTPRLWASDKLEIYNQVKLIESELIRIHNQKYPGGRFTDYGLLWDRLDNYTKLKIGFLNSARCEVPYKYNGNEKTLSDFGYLQQHIMYPGRENLMRDLNAWDKEA